MNSYGVVLFFTSSSALKAEKVLLKGGLTVKLIPTPRQLSSDCGIALRFNWADYEKTNHLLQESRLEYDRASPL